ERIKKVRNLKHKSSKGVFNHRKKNGEIIQVDVQSNIIEFQGIKAELVLANDITERMNYIREVEDRNARLQEIAWIQSHVVRAPSARLMGSGNAVSESTAEDKDRQTLNQVIIKSGNELDDIIKDIAFKADKITLTEEDKK